MDEADGREWLCRRLDERRTGYEPYDNALLSADHLAAAQKLCDAFAHRKWPRVLDALARRVSPLEADAIRLMFRRFSGQKGLDMLDLQLARSACCGEMSTKSDQDHTNALAAATG